MRKEADRVVELMEGGLPSVLSPPLPLLLGSEACRVQFKLGGWTISVVVMDCDAIPPRQVVHASVNMALLNSRK